MKIHFIGIGGIGVSALAKYYLEKGNKISGSDLVSSEITDGLKKKRAKIFIGKHKAKNVPKDVDLIIYSPAVQKDNPELKEAKRCGIKCQSYPQALGELTRRYYTIAVAGTHGKSTTTAMIGLLLTKAGLDPTVIVGTKLKEFGNSNFRMGGLPKSEILNLKSEILVIEADEHFASFLHYWPKIIVLTTIDKDHLDYYRNLNHILKTYKEFIGHLPKNGVLVANRDDKNIQKIYQNPNYGGSTSIVRKKYFIKQKEAKKLKKILKIPGEHNVSNALSALTVARILKIPDKISFKALSEYGGAWRRFEIFERKLKKPKNLKPTCPPLACARGAGRRVTYKLISDYAHHPTEIKNTIKAAREKYLYPVKSASPSKMVPKAILPGQAGASKKQFNRASKIWAVFQPHQHQRTFYLFDDFVKAFDEADEIVLTDIYEVAGRETKEIAKKVNAEQLTQAIKKRGKVIHFVKDFRKIPQFLKKRIKTNDVILIMGAGDIYQIVSRF